MLGSLTKGRLQGWNHGCTTGVVLNPYGIQRCTFPTHARNYIIKTEKHQGDPRGAILILAASADSKIRYICRATTSYVPLLKASAAATVAGYVGIPLAAIALVLAVNITRLLRSDNKTRPKGRRPTKDTAVQHMKPTKVHVLLIPP